MNWIHDVYCAECDHLIDRLVTPTKEPHPMAESLTLGTSRNRHMKITGCRGINIHGEAWRIKRTMKVEPESGATTEDLKKRMNAAKAEGLKIVVVGLENGKMAIVWDDGQFIVLPEDLTEKNTIYCGTAEGACAFLEGLIVGYKRGRK